MTTEQYVIGLYSANSKGGIGACVVDTTGDVKAQCTLLQFGQTLQVEAALKVLAKWAAEYDVKMIGIANGVMFQEIDRIVSILIARYPDMALCRVPVDEGRLKADDTIEVKAAQVATLVDIESAKDLKKRRIAALDKLKPGMWLDGIVLQIKSFGTFIDIGAGVPGLLHSTAEKAHEVGELLSVRVNHVNVKQRKISLSTETTKNSKSAKATPKARTPKMPTPKTPVNTAMADALMKLKRGV